jgi:aquaporin Z
MNKALAEFIGTFTLVFLACGAAIFANAHIGLLGISFAFGLALIGMAYGIGPVSGCHINPAVSLGVFLSGRMSSSDLITYVIAQIAGAIAATAVLFVIANGNATPYEGGYAGNAMQNGYGMAAGLVFEIVATFLFVVVILGSTGKGASAGFAGLAIGLALVAIHLIGIPITNTSVNPARSIDPALFEGGAALAQLWLFIVAPLIGGAAAGLLFKSGKLDAGK